MPKLLFVLLGMMLYGKIFSQACDSCTQVYIYYRLINFAHSPNTLPVYHNVVVYSYKKDEEDARYTRTADYQYIHNGDNLRGAQTLLTDNVQGSDWLKNFDFGKFANIIIEVSPDTHSHSGAAFDWTGKLIFFNLIRKKPLTVRHSFSSGVLVEGE